MNQEKIGKFIAKCRKDKKLTQEDLAQKLGITNKSVSNWENGRNMPDLSIFNELCDELDITINDLLSGERLKKENYQKKLEENVINIIVDEKKKRKKIIKRFAILLSIMLFVCLLVEILYNIIVLDVKYDSRVMNCSFKNNELVYIINGTSVLNTNHIEREIDNQKYIIFHSTINLYNKRHSNWEIDESFAELNYKNQIPYSFVATFDKETKNYDNINVYYADNSLRKLSKMSNNDLLKEIEKLNKICSLK